MTDSLTCDKPHLVDDAQFILSRALAAVAGRCLLEHTAMAGKYVDDHAHQYSEEAEDIIKKITGQYTTLKYDAAVPPKSKRPRKPKKCPSCDQVKEDLTLAPCPFALEIHGDDTPVWKCGECRHQAAMDI